ncbi:MAG: hypothetical protein MUC38_05195 [Cyclobacteriaceae bacterium]|jgi:YbbR domain-containing protein|nr:hypothetical protein [Cyclobacteriaceae bacterium]
MRLLKAISNLFHFNRTNWKAVALCFFAAGVFWFFNALNKTYSTNIRFPIQFEYDQDRYIATRALPEHVTVNVNGSGWDLFRKRFALKEPALVIPVERPSENMKLPGAVLVPPLSTQLPDIKINFVVTDTLFVPIDQRESYTFSLYADLSQLSFREGHGRIGPVVLSANQVKLTGPKHILHQLPDSIALAPRGEDVTTRFSEAVPLVVDYSVSEPERVTVSFDVGRVTTSALPVVNEVRVRPGQKVAVEYAPQTIGVQTPADEPLPATPARLVIDCRKLPTGRHRLLPSVRALPASFQVTSVDSVTVLITF